MKNRFARLEMIAGTEKVEIMKRSRVAVFGVGGVGGYAVEALARSGLGEIDLIDHDTVDPTNINLQIIALDSTVGKPKVEVFAARLKDINPEIIVHTQQCFYLPEEKDRFDFTVYDYIIDAIDTVTAKVDLIVEAQKAGIPIISSMGTGNRLDPSKVYVTDLYQTSGDPLARIMRHELKKRGVEKLTVCTSSEAPRKPVQKEIAEEQKAASNRRGVPGSSPFVPPAAGLAIAAYVFQKLTERSE